MDMNIRILYEGPNRGCTNNPFQDVRTATYLHLRGISIRIAGFHCGRVRVSVSVP